MGRAHFCRRISAVFTIEALNQKYERFNYVFQYTNELGRMRSLFSPLVIYTVLRVSRITFFPTWVIELNTKNSTRWGPHLVEFLVFNSASGSAHALMKTKKNEEGRRRPWSQWSTEYSEPPILEEVPPILEAQSTLCFIDFRAFFFFLHFFWSSSVHVAAEGRVEHQKLNQVRARVFNVQLDYSSRKKSDPASAENRWGDEIHNL